MAMGLFTEIWNFLDTNHRPISALSSIAFGLLSGTVAWLAYRVSQRNSFGLRPVLLRTSIEFSTGQGFGLELTIGYEK